MMLRNVVSFILILFIFVIYGRVVFVFVVSHLKLEYRNSVYFWINQLFDFYEESAVRCFFFNVT